MQTYHGVLHEVAQRRLGRQEQGPSQHIHIIARLRQQVDKALKARPVVPLAAQPLFMSDSDCSHTGGSHCAGNNCSKLLAAVAMDAP